MLTTFLLTMRGTPYCYYGDELGMSNIKFDRISDYRDIATINKFMYLRQTGGDTAAFIEEQKRSARDNGRTPFQWDGSANGGFTMGIPWLKVNPDYVSVNAAAEEKDASSVLSYFRKAVQLRKSNPTLVYGRYTILDRENPGVYAYTREDGQKKFLILLNFKNTPGSFVLPGDIDLFRAKPVLSNYPASGGAQATVGDKPKSGGPQPLRPFEALVYELANPA
jgi:oligo-1,6-glucosidase